MPVYTLYVVEVVFACIGSYAQSGEEMAASYGEALSLSPPLLCMCEKLQNRPKIPSSKFHVLRGRQSTQPTLQVMKTQGAPAQTSHDSWGWVACHSIIPAALGRFCAHALQPYVQPPFHPKQTSLAISPDPKTLAC